MPDLIVNGTVIVDPKVTGIHQTHFAQMNRYLAVTKRELAMLLNFKYAGFRWQRVIRSQFPSA